MINATSMIIVDLEATCWRGHPPKGMVNEVIEIGAVKLNLKDLDAPIEKCQELIVKPKFSTISAFCTDLTSITQEQVDNGIYLDQACNILSEFSGRVPWGSWGAYDNDFLQKECSRKRIQFPLSNRHINLKLLYSVLHGHKREKGLSKAMNEVKLSMEGRHHRGIDDAYNTARLLQYLVRQFRS
jgi:inhibitor of KinA sporulation pathway (predicted exonuclease)